MPKAKKGRDYAAVDIESQPASSVMGGNEDDGNEANDDEDDGDNSTPPDKSGNALIIFGLLLMYFLWQDPIPPEPVDSSVTATASSSVYSAFEGDPPPPPAPPGLADRLPVFNDLATRPAARSQQSEPEFMIPQIPDFSPPPPPRRPPPPPPPPVVASPPSTDPRYLPGGELYLEPLEPLIADCDTENAHRRPEDFVKPPDCSYDCGASCYKVDYSEVANKQILKEMKHLYGGAKGGDTLGGPARHDPKLDRPAEGEEDEDVAEWEQMTSDTMHDWNPDHQDVTRSAHPKGGHDRRPAWHDPRHTIYDPMVPKTDRTDAWSSHDR